jgi:hypothetical protein
MQLFLKCLGEILGHSLTSEIKTDPPMGAGEGPFYPTSFYAPYEQLFRQKTLACGFGGKVDLVACETLFKKIKDLKLTIETEDGNILDLSGATITDVRKELPTEQLILEFVYLHHEQFERIFPGHHAAYVASFNQPRPK